MALNHFYPKQGYYLICDFERGFVPPEIVKPRPVIVVSKTESHGPHRRLCTVVALSTTPPNPELPWHYRLKRNPNPNREADPVWVKGDMIYTVSFARLDKPHVKTHRQGRIYQSIRIAKDELEVILRGLANYLGMAK
jgi:uncharacterized protein YifN (PemK superfamily)